MPNGTEAKYEKPGMLAFPVVLGGVIDLRVPGGDLVERVERLDALVGGEVLHVQAPVAHVGEPLGEGAARWCPETPGRAARCSP